MPVFTIQAIKLEGFKYGKDRVSEIVCQLILTSSARPWLLNLEWLHGPAKIAYI